MNRFLKNTSWVISGQIIQMLINFLVSIFTIRYLGPSNYGVITYVASFVTFFGTIASLGLDTVTMKLLVSNDEKDGVIITSATFLRLVASIICYFSLIIVVSTINNWDKTILIVSIISGIEVAISSLKTISIWYQRRLLSKITSISWIISCILANIYRIFILINNKSIYWFALYTPLLYLIAYVLYVYSFKKDCINNKYVDKKICASLIKQCSPYLFSSIMIVLYSQIDVVMIKFLLKSDSAVGLYSSAINLCKVVGFIPIAIIESSKPILLKMKENNDSNYETRVSQVMMFVVYFTLCYIVFVTIFAKKLILLFYGSNYIDAISVLRIVVWSDLFMYLIELRDLWLLGENKSKYVLIFSSIGTVLNFMLNLFLINILGINGAAIATVITQFFVTVGLPYCIKDTRKFSKCFVDAITINKEKIISLFSLIKGD